VLKLLAMLVTFLVVGMMLLGLRQRRLELTAECSRIYAHIRDQNETLMGQRVEIAKVTNPWVLNAALKGSGVNTGAALEPRQGMMVRTVPAIESDLVAPVR
jgi:hypothetical protein